MSVARCEGCGEVTLLVPLHGGKGGPLRCPLCVGKWNAEHGRKRRTGRIVIRAMKAFYEAGGTSTDIDKLQTSVSCGDLADDLGIAEVGDPLGYLDGIARLDAADIDLTSDLLADLLKLVHPDHHPPERAELAHRVTQRLLALQPFVFPAPKPKPPPAPTSEPPIKVRKSSDTATSRTRYPCSDCADAVPSEYCDACRAEYEKREQQEFEKRTAKQRADYKKARNRLLAKRPARRCEVCGGEFKRSRADARYCSDTCRQRAHRKAFVTGKYKPPVATRTNRDRLERGILGLLDRYPAVFLNDILPDGYSRAQYQALALAANRLEDDGKIGATYYWSRVGKPGHKVLARPGHEVEHPNQVPRLKANERLDASNRP
jgi:hypothetical protein